MKLVIGLSVVYLALFETGLGSGFTVTQEQIDSLNASLEKWRELAAAPDILNQNEDIERLGSVLRKTSNGVIYFQDEKKRKLVHELLKRKLISIPGHAEYYRDRINAGREQLDRVRAGDTSTANLGSAMTDLANEQRYGFQTLSYLPSVETVRVLGDFLEDERGRDGSKPNGELIGESPNWRKAAKAISLLGIANSATPPFTQIADYEPGREAWRNWYRQVKEGRRTFRFVGDPVDYDLRGPSKRGEVVPHERVAKRDLQTDAQVHEVNKPGAHGKTLLPYFVAVGFCVVGLGFYFVRKKRG